MELNQTLEANKMSEKILRVNGANFRMTESGEIEQWNQMQRRYGAPFKNVNLDVVRAAFAEAASGEVPESVEVVPDPALEPEPELSDEEKEAQAEAEALKAKLEEAREALTAAKEKAKKAKARRLARESGSGTGTIGERVYRDTVKMAIVAALQITESEETATVSYSDLISELPTESFWRTVKGSDGTEKQMALTRYEIAKMVRTQLGQLTSVALAGSKVLNLTYGEDGITAHAISDVQKAELEFFNALLRAEKAKSPKKSKLENVGTVGTDEPSEEIDKESEDLDEAA